MTKHQLIDGALKTERERGGIFARCECGWSSGPHFSALAASAAMADHSEKETNSILYAMHGFDDYGSR